MATRSFRVSERDWARIKQLAANNGETATDYLLRRALVTDPDEDASAILREVIFRLAQAGFEIMVEGGKAIRKNEKAIKRRIRENAAKPEYEK